MSAGRGLIDASSEIVSVAAEPLNILLNEPFGIASGAQHRADNVLVRVTLRDGSVGIGEAAPFPAVNGETQADALGAIAASKQALLGTSVHTFRRTAHMLKELISNVPSARCALESALLDALARRAGLSLWSFFGGASPALETDITIPTGDADHAAAAAMRALQAGFRTLKIKVGGTSFDHDIERLRAIVKKAPHAELVLDANASLTAEEAIALAVAIGVGRIALFEQPTARDDYDGLRRVREAGLRVAADESARDARDVIELISARAVDVINIKLMKCGIIDALTMIEAARAGGLALMIGGMVESRLAMTVSACLAAGLGGFSYVDLDTPLFMQNEPFSGGFSEHGAERRVDGIRLGHGVELLTEKSRPGAH